MDRRLLVGIVLAFLGLLALVWGVWPDAEGPLVLRVVDVAVHGDPHNATFSLAFENTGGGPITEPWVWVLNGWLGHPAGLVRPTVSTSIAGGWQDRTSIMALDEVIQPGGSKRLEVSFEFARTLGGDPAGTPYPPVSEADVYFVTLAIDYVADGSRWLHRETSGCVDRSGQAVRDPWPFWASGCPEKRVTKQDVSKRARLYK